MDVCCSQFLLQGPPINGINGNFWGSHFSIIPYILHILIMNLCCRGSVQLQGSLINGIESRLTQVEERLSDLDARGSEEHDNLSNERDLNRFILSGKINIS